MDLASTYLFNNIQKIRYLAKTGISVDIQNLGKNTRCLAIRQKESLVQICKGVFLKKYTQDFNLDNFSNVYDLFWHPKQENVESFITSSNDPFYMSEHFMSDKSNIAAINGSFFFLTDEADSTPVDLPYDLCIRQNKIFGLPSSDQPVVFIKKGSLDAREISAEGIIKIGKHLVNWIGARKTNKAILKNTAILFNSRCSEIVKSRDPLTNIQIGILDTKDIYTPKNPMLMDIVVGMNEKEELVVSDIKFGGGSHFFAGHFILQMRKNISQFKVGDSVKPVSIDKVNLKGITDALTIGKAVSDPFFHDEVRVDRQDARSVIAKDQKGFIHLITFDGSKYVPGFNGVSAKDINTFFTKKHYKWAFFLDGGGSSRIIVKQKNKLHFFANEFSFKKLTNGLVKWDWQKSRKITSSIGLRFA